MALPQFTMRRVSALAQVFQLTFGDVHTRVDAVEFRSQGRLPRPHQFEQRMFTF